MKTTFPKTKAGRARSSCVRLLLALLLLVPAIVQAQDYAYTTNNGTITITQYTGPGGDVTIPSSIDGLPVASIGTYLDFYGNWSGAFQGNWSVTSILIPDSVTNIGSLAFTDCHDLTAIAVDTLNPNFSSLAGVLFDKSRATLIQFPAGKEANYTIPDSVTSIADWAFADCTGLTSITIPSSVTSIGSHSFNYCPGLTSVAIPCSVTNIGCKAFFDCRGLTAITVDALNSSYSSVDGVLFNINQTTLIQCPGGKGGAFTIPNSVIGIEHEAFFYCTGLTDVTIPNSVTSVEDETFSGCSGLTNVTIGNSATNIGYAAFSGCKHLTSVAIGGGVTSIGDDAFIGCTDLTDVTLPNGLTSIGNRVFLNCRSLASVAIPNSVTSMGDAAFGGCSSLASVAIGNGVTSIGINAFLDCTSLTSIIIPNGVTSIGDFAFYSCTSLASATIGNSVTSIGSQAFAFCGLTNITIGNSVATIGDYAFYSTTLTSVAIPASVTNIGSVVFLNCVNLTAMTVDAQNAFYGSVDGVLFNKNQTTLIEYPMVRAGGYTVPTSVRIIGDSAFESGGLTSVTIPDSVTKIGDRAFYSCLGLTTVTMGNGVTTIGEGAFNGCSSLTDVTIPNSLTRIGRGAFGGCISMTTVTMGNGVTTVGEGAFGNCKSLTSVTIPKSITSIGAAAFGGCTNLTAIAVDAFNPTYSSMDGVLFDKSQTKLIECPGGKSGGYTIADGVTEIGYYAFENCTSLTSVTIPKSVTTLGSVAFAGCTTLSLVYFMGNAPNVGSSVFAGDAAVVYYLPGTTGWDTTFGGRPTALWSLPNPLVLTSSPGFGAGTNGFGFIISWAKNLPVVVEASTDLANSTWTSISTNTLTGGSSYFSDPQWTNYPGRFYRLRAP